MDETRTTSTAREHVAGLSSMATRGVLTELADTVSASGDLVVAFASMGGVDLARKVRAGEVADLVVLAGGVIAALADEGVVDPATVTPLFSSSVAVAVPDGAGRPDVSTVEALVAALRAAPSIGYSTGPSGDGLLRLLDAQGIRDQVADRLVQAPAGTPVASLLAEGSVALGVQQRSELANVPGVDVVGPLPPGAEVTTVFTGAVLATSPSPAAARRVLALLADPSHGPVVASYGLDPVTGS